MAMAGKGRFEGMHRSLVVQCSRKSFKNEIDHVWKMNRVTVIPVVIGALGVISDKFERYKEKMDVKIATAIIQKTALLGTARILRKVLSLKRNRKRNFETPGDLLLPALKVKKTKELSRQTCLRFASLTIMILIIIIITRSK